MQYQQNMPNARGKCALCGKAIPIRDTRDKKPRYCDRVCATNAKFGRRYVGTNSSPATRPNIIERIKKL